MMGVESYRISISFCWSLITLISATLSKGIFPMVGRLLWLISERQTPLVSIRGCVAEISCRVCHLLCYISAKLAEVKLSHLPPRRFLMSSCCLLREAVSQLNGKHAYRAVWAVQNWPRCEHFHSVSLIQLIATVYSPDSLIRMHVNRGRNWSLLTILPKLLRVSK